MTLTEAMKRLEIFADQQMNDEMETAIRTVLAEMKRKANIVYCRDCKHNKTDDCAMYWVDKENQKVDSWNSPADFCSWGERI